MIKKKYENKKSTKSEEKRKIKLYSKNQSSSKERIFSFYSI